jgi:hypothetical protein
MDSIVDNTTSLKIYEGEGVWDISTETLKFSIPVDNPETAWGSLVDTLSRLHSLELFSWETRFSGEDDHNDWKFSPTVKELYIDYPSNNYIVPDHVVNFYTKLCTECREFHNVNDLVEVDDEDPMEFIGKSCLSEDKFDNDPKPEWVKVGGKWKLKL